MKRFITYALIIFFAVIISTNGFVLATSAAPNDPMFGQQWGHNNTGQQIYRASSGTQGIDANVLNAWDITKGSSSVIVGVLDTGMDISHVDLSGAIYSNPHEIPQNGIDDDGNGYIDDINGWDFVNDDNTVFDDAEDDDHGTGIAGVIAATGNDGKGICGVAPNVKILPLKFRNGLMVSSDNTPYIIDAIAYAKAMGVTIINCSFTCLDSQEVREAIEKSGILFVCAAGNSSRDLDITPSFPCCYDLPNVLGVASINNKGELSTFSNYGTRVQLAAPGEAILTLAPGNKYNHVSGTSLSVPYVSAVAALIKSHKPNLGANEIAAAIKSSVKPLESLKGKVETNGMLDAYNALKYCDSSVMGRGLANISLSGSVGIDDWYRSDVTVAMHPAEASKLSISYGFDGQTWEKYKSPFTVEMEGVTNLYYYVEDENGLKGAVEIKEIKIDKSKPKIVLLSPKTGDTFILGSKIELNYFINDSSGLVSKQGFTDDIDYIPAAKIGVNTLKLTAEDKAGNTSFLNVKYKVVYKDSRVLEPKEGKTLKCGSPLLVKLSLTDANGAKVETAKAKLFTAFMNKGIAAIETAAKSTIPANASNSFTFDKKLKQYTYSLSTKGLKPGIWRLIIKLDDGTSKYLNIMLKK